MDSGLIVALVCITVVVLLLISGSSWIAFHMGLKLLDRDWHRQQMILHSNGAGVSGFRMHFVLEPVVVIGGPGGIEAWVDPKNVERGTDGCTVDNFKQPWCNEDGSLNYWKWFNQCDSSVQWWTNGFPRIFGVLDNMAQKSRKQAYMAGITTECIERFYWPAFCESLRRNIPQWEASQRNGAANLVELVGTIVFEATYQYLFGEAPAPQQSAPVPTQVLNSKPDHPEEHSKLRPALDDFLWGIGTLMTTQAWRRSRSAALLWLVHIRGRLENLRAQPAASKDTLPMSLMEALAFDMSPHKMDDDAIVNELFHSAFVSYGGITCWTVNALMQLCTQEGEMAKVVMEAEDANGQCSLSFRSLQESCPYTTMAVHETKRIHTCANYFLVGRARQDFSVGHLNIKNGERVIAATWYTNTDPEVWGEDSLEWKPGRMKDIGGASTHQSGLGSGPWQGQYKYAFCAHGAGDRFGACNRRRCAGEELSTLSVKLLVLEVITAFDLGALPSQDLTPLQIQLPVPASGVLVQLTPRIKKQV